MNRSSFQFGGMKSECMNRVAFRSVLPWLFVSMCSVLCAFPTLAFVGGTAPEQVVRETVFGSGIAVGNTLMEHDGTVNFAVKPTGSMQAISSFRMPVDATVVRAFLFWAGSETAFGVDREVDFRLPDGTFFNDLSVDFPTAGEPASALNRCVHMASAGDTLSPYFACRREVTQLLQDLGPGGAVGNYEVSDVDVQPGDCNVDPFCQAMFGGWTVVVIWESPTESIRRDLVLHDSFYAVDEQDFSAGFSPLFPLNNFLVGPSEEGEITVVGFEGDAVLGVPPQNNVAIPPRLFCETCDDFVELFSTSGGGSVRLSDGNNAEGNLFNGSNNGGGGPHPGLDIDTFDLGPSGLGILNEGDTGLQLRVGSGDGIPGGDAGGGELVFLGLSLLSLETFSPRFSGVNTEKVVLETVAGGGETLNYILRFENDGSADAQNVLIADQLPADVSYLAGTTTNTCGVSSDDVGGTSPVLAPGGFNIGTLAQGARCEVRFKAAVNQGTLDGVVLNNLFTISADGVVEVSVGPATTLVESASINTATKTVSVLGGGPPIPGASLLYSIRVENTGGRSAPEVSVVDTLPAELEFVSVVSTPPGSVNDTDAAGNIDVNSITVGGNAFAEVVFIARIPLSTTPGTLILNQATVTQPSLPGPVLTDDPAQPGATDVTRITVASSISLTNSTKAAADVNGGNLVPGDIIEYRIRVDQGATAAVVVNIDDDLPANVEGCVVVSSPPGSTVACMPGGAFGSGRIAGTVSLPGTGSADVVFQVTVSAGAPDAVTVQNQATLTPQGAPAEAVVVLSPAFVVVARPTFVTSTKSVVDENGGGIRPGDVLAYTIVVDNTGPAAATGTVVTDDLDVSLELVPGSISSGGGLAGSRITWNLGGIPATSQSVLSFRARVLAGIPDGTTISNSASIRADAPAENAVAGPVDVVVRAAPTLVLKKAVQDLNGGAFEPGDVVRYSLRLRNTGDGAATRVEIVDPISPFLSEVALLGQGRVVGSNVIFDATTVAEFVSMLPGDDVTLMFDARVATPLANGTLVQNQANARANETPGTVLSDDPATAAALDATSFSVTSSANLVFTKVALDENAGVLAPGDRVEVVLRIENTGNAPAENVEVRDVLDANLVFDSFVTSGLFIVNEVIFNTASHAALGSIGANAVELRFRARIKSPLADGTLIPNQATLSSSTAPATVSDDPNTVAPLDPTILRVESRPVLDDATKVVIDLDGDGIFEPGDRIRYEINVANLGTEDASSVVITDLLAPELVDIVVLAGNLAGQEATWNVGNLAVGDAQTLVVEATLSRPLANATSIANQARISQAGQPDVVSDDPATAALDDATRFSVTSNPRVVFTKAVTDLNGGVFEPGDDVTYTLNVRNIGGRAAVQVQIDDVLPTELVDVNVLSGGSLNAGTATWTSAGTPALASLEVDQEATVVVQARLSSPLANGILVANQASASLGEQGVPGFPILSDDPVTGVLDDPTVFQVVSAANLTATTLETLDNNNLVIASARPADDVQLALVVRNSGTEAANAVTVRLPIPAEYIVDDGAGGRNIGNELVFSQNEVAALATVSPGDEITLRILGHLAFPLDDGQVLSFAGEVGAQGVVFPFPTDDPSTPAASDPTLLTIESDADLTIEKTFVDFNAGQPEPGDVLQYILLLRNIGDGPAHDVVVRDVLPAEVEFVSSTTGGYFSNGAVFFTSLPEPDLALVQAGDAPIELRFEVRIRENVLPGTLVVNQAEAQGASTPLFVSDDPSTAVSRDATRFEVFTNPRLAMTKDVVGVSGRIFAPDEILTYTFVITSVGTAPSTAAQFLDVVPAALVSVNAGPGLVFDPADRTLRGSVPPLLPGSEHVFSMTAQVFSGASNGTVVENQAQVQAADIGIVQSDDPTTAAEVDSTVGLVEAMPVLTTSTKEVFDENGGTYMPGDVVRYLITLRNTGNGRARDLTVTDALDAAAFVLEEVQNGGVSTGNVVTWNADTTAGLSDLGPGEELELVVRARLRNTIADNTEVQNQAQIQSRDLEEPAVTDDPSTPAPSDATRFRVSAPRLVFEKSISVIGGGVLRPGTEISYGLRLQNLGSADANNVVIQDLLPTELVDVVLDSGGLLASGLATWDAATTSSLASFAPGDELSVTIRAQIDPLVLGGTLVRNQATVQADEVGVEVQSDDPSTAAIADATVRSVQAEERFSGSVLLFDVESGAPIVSDVVPDQRVRARIRIENIGSQASQAVVVNVPLLRTFFRAEEANLGGVFDEGGIRWTASQDERFRVMSPGDVVELEFSGSIAKPIADETLIQVRALLSSVTTEEPFVFGPAEMRVRSRPDLSASEKLVTDDNGGVVEPGDVLTWRITAINNGGATARDTRLFDATPPATTYIPNSTLLRGEPVADASGNPLANGLFLGDVQVGRAVVVSFKTRVSRAALRGLRIDNQGQFLDDRGSQWLTDNPATPFVLADATSVLVGGGPLLVSSKVASPAVVDVGGQTIFEIAVENGGSDLAESLRLDDLVKPPARYIPGSASLEGLPLSDEEDGDAFSAEEETGGTRIRLSHDVLEAGEGLVLRFAVTALEGPAVENQAIISSLRVAETYSDGEPMSPGAQVTVVPVGGERLLLVGDNGVDLHDDNGDVLEAGDAISGAVTLRNRSLETVVMSSLSISLSQQIDMAPDAFETQNGVQLDPVLDPVTSEVIGFAMADGLRIEVDAGESFSLPFHARVAADAVFGDVVRIVAGPVSLQSVDGTLQRTQQLGDAQLRVGLLPGTGALQGVVFADHGAKDGVFQLGQDDDEDDEDLRIVGFQVHAFLAGQPEGEPVRTAVTNDDGEYQLPSLPAGAYRLEVRSSGGALFATKTIDVEAEAYLDDEHLRIDPSGSVYNAATYVPLRGQQVFLYVDDGDGDTSNDLLVDDGDLLDGQQGQITGPQGLYRFDPFPGDYRLQVVPASPLFSFPSSAIAPVDDGEHPFGAVALPAEDGTVVAHAQPSRGLDSTYYLRFSLALNLPPVLNNHVPVDGLRDGLSIQKTANRRSLTMGDLVAYTVTLKNSANAGLSVDEGGVEFVDTLPQGFVLVPNSWDLHRIRFDSAGQRERTKVEDVLVVGRRILRFGAFALEGNASYELRYQVVVGPGTPRGLLENRALLRTGEGQVPLTSTAVAKVRVVDDPMFDLGSLRAKVFCDDDRNGTQNSGERGIYGSRIYLDTGSYAESDESGKLHFSSIPPGMHLAKIDTQTLPYGVAIQRDERVNFYISPGLPAQVEIPVSCTFSYATHPQLVVNEGVYRGPEAPPAPTRDVQIRGQLNTGALSFDEVKLLLPVVDLGVSLEAEEPAFGRSLGPNLSMANSETLRETLHFVPRLAADVPVTSWQLTLLAVSNSNVDSVANLDAGVAMSHAPKVKTGNDAGIVSDSGSDDEQNDAGSSGEGSFAVGNRLLASLKSHSASGTSEQGEVSAYAGSVVAESSGATEVTLPAPDMLDAHFQPLWVFAGEGPPPERISWDGKNPDTGVLVLTKGQRYQAIFSVLLDGGDEAASLGRPFGVALGDAVEGVATEPFNVVIDASDGPLFTKGKPSARLLQVLAKNAAALGALEGTVLVEVHATEQKEGIALAAQTATEAQQIAQALAALGIQRTRIAASGQGNAKPLRPNLRKTDRLKNRRIEVRVEEAPLRYAALEPIESRNEVWVNGVALENVDVNQPFETLATAPVGSTLTVEILSNAIGRRAYSRSVLEGPFAETLGAQRSVTSEVSISGSLVEQSVVLGERKISLAVLGSQLEAVHQASNGVAVGVVHDDRAELVLKHITPKEVDVVRWRFRISEILHPKDQAESGADKGREEVLGPTQMERFQLPTSKVDLQRLHNARRTLFEQEGEGPLPDELVWDGKNREGKLVVEAGQSLLAKILFTTRGGDKVVSAELPVVLLTSLGSGAGETRRDVLQNPYTKKGNLKRSARRKLRRLARKLKESSQRVVVKVHADDAGPRLTRRTRTQRTAEAARAILIKAGIAAERISALGLGSDEPLVPNFSRKSKRKNRRLVVVLEAPPNLLQPGVSDAVDAKVVANGRGIKVQEDGSFSGAAPASRSGEVSLMVRSSTGIKALLHLREVGSELWQGRPEALLARASQKGVFEEPLLGPPLGDEDAGEMLLSRTPDAGVSAVDAGSSELNNVDSGALEGELLLADGGAPQKEVADAGSTARPKLEPKTRENDDKNAALLVARERVPFTSEGAVPGWWPYLDEVPAAQLSVALPPESEVLHSNRLWVHGKTLPQNRVHVMGREVHVDDEGNFSTIVPLADGSRKVVVSSEDVLGNKASVERLYVVDTTGWFFLLFGEGMVGQKGALQKDRTFTTSLTLGDYFAHGRAVAYVKGSMQSKVVFRDIDVTLHLDNRRWEDGIFERNLNDPDRFMPAFGDSSVEIQEVKALYPIYLDVKADHSRLRIGNIKTRIEGGDLFRYTRSRYGAQLVLDRGWEKGTQFDLDDDKEAIADPKKDDWRTTLTAFGSVGAASSKHARVELMGTGGSLYYLRHSNLIEGSERVSVVVRDAITGSEIARTPKQRNVDYSIRYGEGRVLFNEPIASLVDAAFGLNHNLGQVQSGHRVFIEVEYDHNDLEPFQGVGGGAQLKQVLFGHLELGGGYLIEAREDGSPAYQLGGMHAKLFLDDNTWLKGEWAWSSSIDAGNYMSLDGGLSFAQLGQGLDDDDVLVGNTVLPAARQGFALKLEGQALLGEYIGRNDNDLFLRGWAQHQSAGFFAGAAIVEQGQSKWGVDGAWRITDKDQLRLRYDSVLSEVPVVPHAANNPFVESDNEFSRSLHRHLVTLRYTRQLLKGLNVGGELGYGFTYDSGTTRDGDVVVESRDIHTTAAALLADWQALERLHLSFKQEMLFTGDDKQLQAWNDHFISHIGLRFQLTKDLAITGSESLRWNGENQTQVGLRWTVNDKARVYASERMGFGANGFTNATVFGGETDLAPGSKMYAEYQLTSAFSNESSRGVVGLANQWKLPFGLTLNFGYERTQMVGGAQSTTTTTVAPGAFTDGTLFAAPGKNLGGSALLGSGSRDAGWVGVEYSRGEIIRASQRFELRYDNFDESRGGHDRIWATSLTNVMWKLSSEFSVLARYNFAIAQDTTRGQIEARMEEGLLGLAYRPSTHDWLSIWAKLKRRSEVRPVSLAEGRIEDYTTHALSLEPIVELPWDIQLVQKLALKHASQTIDDLPRADALTGLSISRVNWHILRTFRRFNIDPLIPGDVDLGIEYRFLGGIPAMALEHGALVELQVAPVPYFRVGVGWNFTGFSDDELAREDRDYSGFFIRAIGQY
ncbi:MAG: DUF11 domain-containing protein [Deltaproteobacteria bacterium]|nr:DUF11 domain-containing protein [Deltaproteobacteria bacterium]